MAQINKGQLCGIAVESAPYNAASRQDGPSKKTTPTPTQVPASNPTDADYILTFINNEFAVMAKNTLVNRYQVKVTPPKLTTKCYLRWAPHQSTRAMRSDLMYGDILTAPLTHFA